MYSPALLLIREANKDYQVPNSKHVIPKGSQLWINSLGFQYDEKYYPNPMKFDPERFTQEEINKRPHFTFLVNFYKFSKQIEIKFIYLL